MNIQKESKAVPPGTSTSSVADKVGSVTGGTLVASPVAEPVEASYCNDSIASGTSMVVELCRTTVGELCRTTVGELCRTTVAEPVEAISLPPVERHPFEPFLPENSKVLMLGSFPPQPKCWSMEFYYPNFINDMWRILGLIFFGDKDRFVDIAAKKFKLNDIVDFCTKTGIAMYDTASAVRRLKDNASDKFLEIVTPTDIPALLREIPRCQAIVTTGEKATETLCRTFEASAPSTGEYSEFLFEGRPMRLYRMPSSSRAYPLPLDRKAAAYRRLFIDLGMV